MKYCTHCGRQLTAQGGIEICLVCNQLAPDTVEKSDGKVIIECPGATLYDVETGRVLQGVSWIDPNDPQKGYEIVGEPVFAPRHTARRLIEPDQVGRITRCRACQDYTIRMRAGQRDHKTQERSAARRRAENLFRH